MEAGAPVIARMRAGYWGLIHAASDRDSPDWKSSSEFFGHGVIDDLYSNPVCVICFNLSEGWVRDVSEEITRKLRQRCADQTRELPDSLHRFVEQAAGT
jgi:hypothetical protein